MPSLPTLVLTVLLASLSGLSAGCSGDSAQVPQVDAGFSINGHPFSTQALGAGQVLTNGDVSMIAGWIVELYNSQTAGCLQFMSSAQSGTVLQFHLPVVATGTHDVSIGNTIFYVNGDPNAATPDHGTIHVIADDCTHVVGSYDVTFKSGEHLAGTFDAPTCVCESKDAGASRG